MCRGGPLAGVRARGGDCFFASVTVNRLAALQLPWDRHRAQELSLPWRCALSFRHVTCVYKCACPWAQGRRNSSCRVVWKLQERSGLTPLPTPPGKTQGIPPCLAFTSAYQTLPLHIPPPRDMSFPLFRHFISFRDKLDLWGSFETFAGGWDEGRNISRTLRQRS